MKNNIILSSGDAKRCIFIALLSTIWMGVAPSLYNLILTRAIERTDAVYSLFNNNLMLNIPICIVLIYLCLKCCEKIYHSKIINYSIFLVVAFCYIVLYYQSPFIYAKIAWNVDFRLFLSILLCVVLITMMTKWFVLYRQNETLDRNVVDLKEQQQKRFKYYLEECKNGPFFSPDNNHLVSFPESRSIYADMLIDKLKLIPGSLKESIAIGITSEWGAGKTTFLNHLKEKINVLISNDVIDFNPWMCQSPEQVTRDFFATLRNKLSENHPELSNPIKQYAKHLGAISFPVFGIASINLNNFVSEKNLLELKNNLSEKFNKLSKPIVVVIDDLDRLDSSEVFEVLRLIRNTADFSKIIYLVAYDKNYITKILEKKHISDPSAYLDKIFQMEILLPKVTKDEVWKTLINELRFQLPKNADLSYLYDERELILKIINTYRCAKRFARLFSLDYYYLLARNKLFLVKREKFLLDLLQMDDKTTYDMICDKPSNILCKEGDIWEYNEDSIDKDTINIKSTTGELLKSLWPKCNDAPKEHSIRYSDYMMEYFSMANVQFSVKDFEEVINSDDVESTIQLHKEKEKRFDNYNDIVKAYYFRKDLSENQKKNIILSILSLNYHSHSSQLSYNIYDIDIPNLIFTKENKGLILEWLNNKMDAISFNNYSPFMLHGLLFTLNDLKNYYEDYEQIKKEIICKMVQRFVKCYDCSILDIINVDNSSWFLYYKYSEFLNCFNGENSEIAINHLIEVFSPKKPKPSKVKYETSLEDNKLFVLFGPDWRKYLEEILQKCFE